MSACKVFFSGLFHRDFRLFGEARSAVFTRPEAKEVMAATGASIAMSSERRHKVVQQCRSKVFFRPRQEFQAKALRALRKS